MSPVFIRGSTILIIWIRCSSSRLPEAKYNLDAGSGMHGEDAGGIEKVLLEVDNINKIILFNSREGKLPLPMLRGIKGKDAIKAFVKAGGISKEWERRSY